MELLGSSARVECGHISPEVLLMHDELDKHGIVCVKNCSNPFALVWECHNRNHRVPLA